MDAIYIYFTKALDTGTKGEVASQVFCPCVPRKYADTDTFISGRKVSASRPSGEWCSLVLVTCYKWSSTGQCIY